MLQDPNFNILDLTLRNMEKGVAFSEYYYTNPIDGREIPTVVGIMDLSHNIWKDSKITCPSRVMLAGRHAKGIYVGFPLDQAIEISSTKVVSDMPTFDLSTGMWYTSKEFSESLNREDWDSTEPLLSGKPRPNHNRMVTCYGLADNITQVLKHYRKVLARTDYDVVIHVRQYDKESSEGIRWHKQGGYLGHFKKKCEYIHDEVGFNRFIQFHLYVIKQEG